MTNFLHKVSVNFRPFQMIAGLPSCVQRPQDAIAYWDHVRVFKPKLWRRKWLTYFYRGGGIGGLTLAVALSSMGLEDLVQVDIYESAPQLTQIGAGITLWPRAWNILEKLGLDAALVGQLSPGQHIPDGKPREEEYL